MKIEKISEGYAVQLNFNSYTKTDRADVFVLRSASHEREFYNYYCIMLNTRFLILSLSTEILSQLSRVLTY